MQVLTTAPNFPQASAFKLFRDAATKQYGWLLGTAPSLVVDWERACGSIRSLLDGFSAIDGTEERSASYCARVGTECERRGWHGPTVTLLARAAQLEPASVDAQLALATALLRCGRASEARETFAAARQREEDQIEALVGEERGARCPRSDLGVISE
jgi:hypothetical protein